MNVARCSDTKSSLNRSAKIREDVAKQIVADDHIVLRRIENHEHRHRIDVLVIGSDLRVSSRNFLEHALPKVTAKALNVRLVGHSDTFAFVLLCILKGRNDDSLNATSRVHLFLQRDLVHSSLFQETAGTAISAFCVLAKDDEINVASQFLFCNGVKR
jgi:hypothetical protein